MVAAAALSRRTRTPCASPRVRAMHARCGSGRGEVDNTQGKDAPDGTATTSGDDDVNSSTSVVTISYQGRRIPAQAGAILRTALLRGGVTPHNTVDRPLGDAKLVNCRGLGTCGTCAVQAGAYTRPLLRST